MLYVSVSERRGYRWEDGPRWSGLREIVYRGNGTARQWLRSRSRMVALIAKRSTVLSIVAAIISDLFDGWYSLIAGTRRLRLITSCVLGREFVHPLSPTDRRIVRCRSDGKPRLHGTIITVLSNSSIPLPGGLAIESSSSLVRRHDERRRSQGAL